MVVPAQHLAPSAQTGMDRGSDADIAFPESTQRPAPWLGRRRIRGLLAATQVPCTTAESTETDSTVKNGIAAATL